MTTYPKEWSDYSAGALSESDKAYFRAMTRRHIHNIVLDRFCDLSERGFKRSDLADRLGVDRAQVTRWLASPGNWTVDTLSDLLLGMSCRACIRAEEISAVPRGNFAHSASTLSSLDARAGSQSDQWKMVVHYPEIMRKSTAEAA